MIDAYEPPPPNYLVRPIAVVALFIIGGWNLAGWWLSDGPLAYRLLLTAMTITFEVLGANVSAQKSRAELRDVSQNVKRFWLGALVMCSGWSIFSAHNALQTLTPDMNELQHLAGTVVLSIAAFIVPLMPWAVERTENAPLLPKQPPAEVAPTEPVSPLAPDARPQRETTRGALRVVGKAALAASVVGVPTVGPAPEGWRAPAAQVRPLGDDAWRAHARALWIAGERNKSAIARAVGRPRETVRRELAKLGA